MLIYLRCGRDRHIFVRENTNTAIARAISQVDAAHADVSHLWMAAPTNEQQHAALLMLLVKSAAHLLTLPLLRHLHTGAFPLELSVLKKMRSRYSDAELTAIGNSGIAPIRHSPTVPRPLTARADYLVEVENMLRKLLNMLEWVERWGTTHKLTPVLFKKETFRKVAVHCLPLLEGKVEQRIVFPSPPASPPASTADSTADNIIDTPAQSL